MGSKHDEKVEVFKDIWKLTKEDEVLHESIKDNHQCIYEVIEASQFSFGKNMKAYLINMTVRLIELHRILKETGSVYIHCDPTASHYLKIIMDCIFGVTNFRNEIVWGYKSGGAGKKTFAKKHDIIFFYTKSDTYTFDAQYYKRYLLRDKETGKEIGKDPRKDKVQYETDALGTYRMNIMRDVWDDIGIISPNSKAERTGYPTQKPLALLERIVRASSNENDIVFDAFCGCATALVAAEKLKRQWIGIDLAPIARHLVKKRLKEEVFISEVSLIKEYKPIFRTDIPEREDIEKVENNNDIKDILFTSQEERCNGCCHQFPKRSLTKDHIVPRSKGGQDIDSNIQLLCGFCNSTKGDRTQEYLLKRLDELGIRDITQTSC